MAKRNSRATSMRKLAHELKAQYSKKDDFGILEFLRDFKLFKTGGRKEIYNVMEFADGDIKLYVFDYKYIIQSNNARKTFRQSVLFINSKELGLPDFRMHPEHIFHRLGQWLNLMEDIDFDSYPDFSKQYYLKGPQENFIRYKFKEEILEFFTDEKNWTLEGLNYYFIFYKDHKLIRVDHLHHFIGKGLQLYEFLKEEEE